MDAANYLVDIHPSHWLVLLDVPDHLSSAGLTPGATVAIVSQQKFTHSSFSRLAVDATVYQHKSP